MKQRTRFGLTLFYFLLCLSVLGAVRASSAQSAAPGCKRAASETIEPATLRSYYADTDECRGPEQVGCNGGAWTF